MKNNQRIAVLGASGKAGTVLLQQLLDRGYTCKALVRHPEKFTITSPLLKVVQGDATSYGDMQLLLQDCTVVISTLGQRKDEPPVLVRSITHVLQAMRYGNIQRYIQVTGLTIDVPGDRKSFRTRLMSRLMRWMFPTVIAEKQQEYTLLSNSAMDWTLLRIPRIEVTTETGSVKIDLYDCPGSRIRVADLANIIIEQLSDDRYIRKSPFVASI